MLKTLTSLFFWLVIVQGISIEDQVEDTADQIERTAKQTADQVEDLFQEGVGNVRQAFQGSNVSESVIASVESIFNTVQGQVEEVLSGGVEVTQEAMEFLMFNISDGTWSFGDLFTMQALMIELGFNNGTTFSPTEEAVALAMADKEYQTHEVAAILSYHLIPDEVILKKDFYDGQELTTALDGKKLTVVVEPELALQGETNQAELLDIDPIVSEYGVVHFINQVLLPEF